MLHYIQNNENGHNIRVIHCSNGNNGENEKIEKLIPFLKDAGVYPFFNIKFEYIDEEFGPEVIAKIAERDNVPRHRIFIGSIHNHHNFDYEDLGGVRIIF